MNHYYYDMSIKFPIKVNAVFSWAFNIFFLIFLTSRSNLNISSYYIEIAD
jgi:hypothetical protein